MNARQRTTLRPVPTHRNVYLHVQELIGNHNTWPRFIPNYLFCADLTYRYRVILGSFFYGNGIDEFTFMELLWFCNPTMNDERHVKLFGLYVYWNDENYGYERRSRYFSMDLILGRVVNLNGEFRVENEHMQRPPGPFLHVLEGKIL